MRQWLGEEARRRLITDFWVGDIFCYLISITLIRHESYSHSFAIHTKFDHAKQDTIGLSNISYLV